MKLHKRVIAVIGAAAALSTCANAYGQACTYGWADGSVLDADSVPGLSGTVFAAVVFNDGSGDALYVGGSFTLAGDTPAASATRRSARTATPNPADQTTPAWTHQPPRSVRIGHPPHAHRRVRPYSGG